MAETQHIEVPEDDWIALPAANALSKGMATNSGNTVLVYTQAINKPAADSTLGYRLVDDNIFTYTVQAPELIWIRALHKSGIVSVTPDLPADVDTRVSNGVPLEFTKITANASTVTISKGNLNQFEFVPRVRNEHAAVSSVVQGVVNATTVVGQVFKASQDNISALILSLESAQGVLIDDFESYANDTELQAVWTTTLANLAQLETDPSFTGSQAMRLLTDVNAEEWSRTSAPQDFTGYTGKFKSYFSNAFAQQQVAVFIRDNLGNSKSFVITQTAAATLCNCEVNEAAMIDDQPTVTDVENIVEIGYRVVQKRAGSFVIIDDLVSVPPPGFVRVKLWDMGATLPEDGVTSIDTGTQYDQIGVGRAAFFDIALLGGRRIYHLEQLYAGVDKEFPDNKLITVDNYYIIQLEYVDTDVNVYGMDPSYAFNLYQNGYAFTAPDEATPITQIGTYADIFFGIMSAQPVYFTRVGWKFDNPPNGDSSILVYMRDTTGLVTEVVVDHEDSPEEDFVYDVESRPLFLDSGDKLMVMYNDDPTDSVSRISGEVQFWFQPPIING